MKSARTNFLLAVTIIALMVTVVTGYFGIGTAVHPEANVASAATALFDEETVASVYEQVSPAVVEIKVKQPGTGWSGWYGMPCEGQGSGFLIDEDGHILTNNHVVEGASSVEVVLDQRTSLDGEVVGQDPFNDLTLVKVLMLSNIWGIAIMIAKNYMESQVHPHMRGEHSPCALRVSLHINSFSSSDATTSKIHHRQQLSR